MHSSSEKFTPSSYVRRARRWWIAIWVTMGLFSGCVTPISSSPMMNIEEESVSPEEAIIQLINYALVVRVIPNSGSNQIEKFCVAAALQPDLLITTAACVKDGVRYAEVKSGTPVTFYDSEERVGIVTHFAMHPGYNSIPLPTSYDFALLRIGGDPDTLNAIPLVEVFTEEPVGLENLVRVGYHSPSEEENLKRLFSVGESFIANLGAITFSMNPAMECSVSGSLVLTMIEGAPKLVALSSYGDAECLRQGGGSLTQPAVEWIQEVYSQGPANMMGLIEPQLKCKESFNCFGVPQCYRYLDDASSRLFDTLAACANAEGCFEATCYPDVCPEEYEACLE